MRSTGPLRVVWETSLSTFLMSVALLWTLEMGDESPPPRKWIFFGVLWGVITVATDKAARAGTRERTASQRRVGQCDDTPEHAEKKNPFARWGRFVAHFERPQQRYAHQETYSGWSPKPTRTGSRSP